MARACYRQCWTASSRGGRARLAERTFLWYWVSLSFAFYVAFTSAGKTIVALTHTDMATCNARGVMASTSPQPIRRPTVARTGSAALEDGPGASGSAAQIFAPQE